MRWDETNWNGSDDTWSSFLFKFCGYYNYDESERFPAYVLWFVLFWHPFGKHEGKWVKDQKAGESRGRCHHHLWLTLVGSTFEFKMTADMMLKKSLLDMRKLFCKWGHTESYIYVRFHINQMYTTEKNVFFYNKN